MAIIKVKKIEDVQNAEYQKESVLDLCARFCLYYPVYTYEEALRLPLKTIYRLLKIATKERAKLMIRLLEIARAAQYDKPDAFNQLRRSYEEIING
jgi:hypothetical protein